MEKKKAVKTFGPLDILLIVAALCVLFFIAAAMVKDRVQTPLAASGAEVLFTVELERKEAGFEENVVVGDELFDSIKGQKIGVITDVSVLPYESPVQDKETGTYKSSKVDGLVTILVTAKAGVSQNDRETLANGVDIAVEKKCLSEASASPPGALA
jgi:hypothetical protein